MATRIGLHVWGDLALFTRPEMKVERVSYDVITPSAARGIVEAIYWKPEIRWHVLRLYILRPIRFTSLRRNELACKIPAGSVSKAMKAGRGSLGLYVEEERQQRAATLLRDVEYVIEARFEIVGGENNVGKHLDQFNRRARAGRCHTRPYLGCREFPAEFSLVERGQPPPPVHPELRGERDIGYMLHDMEYVPDPKGTIVDGHYGKRWRAEPRFYRAIMRDGVIDVPSLTAGEGR